MDPTGHYTVGGYSDGNKETDYSDDAYDHYSGDEEEDEEDDSWEKIEYKYYRQGNKIIVEAHRTRSGHNLTEIWIHDIIDAPNGGDDSPELTGPPVDSDLNEKTWISPKQQVEIAQAKQLTNTTPITQPPLSPTEEKLYSFQYGEGQTMYYGYGKHEFQWYINEPQVITSRNLEEITMRRNEIIETYTKEFGYHSSPRLIDGTEWIQWRKALGSSSSILGGGVKDYAYARVSKIFTEVIK